MLRRFFSIVPKTVQLWASVVVGCALLVGLVVGYKAAGQGAVFPVMAADGSIALLTGTVLAIWLLCLGFVFADARRRAIASTCTQCGKTVPLHQPFCSWCGASLAAPNGPLAAGSLPQASQ